MRCSQASRLVANRVSAHMNTSNAREPRVNYKRTVRATRAALDRVWSFKEHGNWHSIETSKLSSGRHNTVLTAGIHVLLSCSMTSASLDSEVAVNPRHHCPYENVLRMANTTGHVCIVNLDALCSKLLGFRHASRKHTDTLAGVPIQATFHIAQMPKTPLCA